MYGFASFIDTARKVGLVNDERLGSVFDVNFTIYDYSLNTNKINDENSSLLPAYFEFRQGLTYLCNALLSMLNSNFHTLEYMVVIQVMQGVCRTM